VPAFTAVRPNASPIPIWATWSFVMRRLRQAEAFPAIYTPMLWMIIGVLALMFVVGHVLQIVANVRSEMRFGPRSENRWVIENERINAARRGHK
jgi:hypothetical protein